MSARPPEPLRSGEPVVRITDVSLHYGKTPALDRVTA